MLRLIKDERGAYAVPAMYAVIALLSLSLAVYGISWYWLGVLQENIQTKLDMSNWACYPSLHLENLANTASVALVETEARKTFELMLARQLNLDETTLQAPSGSSLQQLKIDTFKIYGRNEVPATLQGGRIILHSPAIESQITAFVRIPFIDRSFPFTFRSVTELPQTP
ncbi:hypothetical protein [Effusibacillus lacus]|uniref:Uncharacterized protein n=1 Tax=Effusibacillus lacus TaxID=1348429 RepID=A0A292YPZ5_9BACL|nr:hypothetical protein [Effusibacillus lacus]TCS76927.1 hypothetical protein EDD64_101151 [Effusibacillus lacus]GAX91256.1 hypothetical protein EFBL_2922 [Effusibacillus lacus]